MEPGARRSSWIERRLVPSLAVCLVLVGLEARLLSEEATLGASNVLQLSLAAWAAFTSFRAGARERGLPRWFFALFGLGMALWALAQGILTLSGSAAPPRLLVAVQDSIFVSATVPLITACALRPHRPRPGALGLAADVGLLCVLTFFVQLYFPFARQALGGADPAPDNPVFFNPQRLMLLGGMLFLRRGSDGAWRRLYDELALAMVVYTGLGVLPNLDLFAGTYRPGLSDLPWTLPFLWVALAARDWQPRGPDAASAHEVDLANWQAGDWKEARRGSTLALAAVALVPVVHQLATVVGSTAPELVELRSRIALLGTLLVGLLYLARQLHTLRRVARMQRAREERFRALVENSADTIGVVDAFGTLSYLSASSERVTGFPPDELMHGSPLQLVRPGEVDSLRRALAEISSRPGASARGLVHFRHKDGGFRHGVIDAVNRLDTPAVSGVVLHLRDVTDQHRAEQERERSLSLLEATLESTADGIVVTDTDGRIERSNQRFAAMWRIPGDMLAAHDDARVRELVLDQLEQPQSFLDRVSALREEPDASSFDSLRFKDGRVIERYSLPQRLAGEVVGRVWSFRDVSERDHAERAMARLVAIIEATPDFVATCDAALRPLYVNRAGRRMVGLGDEQPLAKRHIGEFHPRDAGARLLEEAVPSALREGVWSGETRLRHQDGREIPVLQVVLAHRSADGEVDFLSTIARDISQRMKAEQELRRSHTMAALGSLVAGVAHEVRNPLFGIGSTLDAFEARFAGRQDHGRYVQVLREQLARLTSLMNDLIEYAKPSRLELRQGRLDGVVASALSACAALQQRARVTIEARIPPDLPLLRMDEGRLTQVFQNLLENALQHSPAGARVSLEARVLPGRDGWVECSVEDDGPGFSQSDLPHLFEPFFTRRPGGTGLGLSIVQRIVTDHGGTIAAANRPERGARVSLTLEVAPEGGP